MVSLKNIICRIDNKFFKIGKRKKRDFIKKYIGTHNRETIRCGNEYGGFDVCPLELEGRKIIVYSFGIGEDLSFSEDVLKHFQAEIYAFDPTPRAIDFVKNNDLYKRAEFHFKNYALGGADGEDTFYLPKNKNYVSGSMERHEGVETQGIKIKKRKLKSIMNECGHSSIDLLKMDIEGSEFEVMENILDENVEFTQLCVEVHDRFLKDGDIKLKNILSKLSEAGYVLISASDRLEEFTFVKA